METEQCVKTPERHQLRRSGVFIVNFKQISRACKCRLGYLDNTLIFPVVQFETFTPTFKKIQYINLNVAFIIIGNINASIRHAFES